MVSPEVVDHFATKLGIDRGASKKGVASVTTLLVGGLAKRSNDSHAMGAMAAMINESPDEPADVNRMLSHEDSPMRRRGQQMLDLAVSDHGGMVSQISRTLGIGSGTATSMLATIATLAMGAFRRFGRSHDVTGASLGGLLREASGTLGVTDTARAAIPMPAPRAVEVERTYQHATAQPVAHHRRSYWWLVLIPIAAIAIWLFARGRGPETHVTTPSVPTVQNRPASPVEARRPHTTMGTPQPLSFPDGSTEAAFLANVRARSGANSPWFDLDKINFASGTATPSEASTGQITSIAEILKAYPRTRIRIAGSTEAAGNPETSMQLSKARAQSIQQALVAQGIDASRMEVEARANPRASIQVIER